MGRVCVGAGDADGPGAPDFLPGNARSVMPNGPPHDQLSGVRGVAFAVSVSAVIYAGTGLAVWLG